MASISSGLKLSSVTSLDERGVQIPLGAQAGQELRLAEPLIDRAQHAIPAQGASKWSCGPNQVARTLVLLGRDAVDLTSVKAQCPRVCGATGPLIDEIDANPVARVVARTVLRWSPIGPPPAPLSRYVGTLLDAQTPRYRAHYHQLATFAGVLELMEQELRQQRPVIVLIGMGPLAWHYWNVVGLHLGEDWATVLDTNQSRKRIALTKLDELMFFSDDKLWGIKLGGLVGLDTSTWIGAHNCISFLPHQESTPDALA